MPTITVKICLEAQMRILLKW